MYTRRAEASSLSRIASNVIGRKTRVFLDPPMDGAGGYTVAPTSPTAPLEIHVVYEDDIISNLSDELKVWYRKGVTAHEILHQCLTDFDYSQEVSQRYESSFEQGVFHTFANTIEDPAIEYFAPNCFGGALLKALRFMIRTVYNMSPSLNEMKGSDPYTELINAMIQFGDMGIVKGTFTHPEAEEAFKKIAPLYNKAITCPDAKKRMDIAAECVELTRDLWEPLKKLSDLAEKMQKAVEESLKSSGAHSKKGEEKKMSGSSTSASKKREKTIKKMAEDAKDGKESSEKDSSESSKSSDKTSKGGKKGHDTDDSSSRKDGAASERGKKGTASSKNTKDDAKDGTKESEKASDADNADSRPESENSDGDSEDNASESDSDDTDDKSGDESDSKSGDDSDGSEDGSDGKSKDKSDDKSKEDSADSDDGEKSDEEDESDDGDDEKSYEPTEDELESLEKAIADEEAKLAAEDRKDKEAAGDLDLNTTYVTTMVGRVPVYHVKEVPHDDAALMYSTIVNKYRKNINQLVRSLKHIFEAEQDEVNWGSTGNYNIYRGTIGCTSKIFDKRKDAGNAYDVAVMLLVDLSGSMYCDQRYQVARDTTIVFAEALSTLKIPYYVCGFDADRRYDGIDANSAIQHHFVGWHDTLKERTSICNMQPYFNNFDSASIKAAAEILRKKNAAKKLMIVISDGLPECREYSSMREGIADTKAAIREANRVAPVFGIALGDDSSPAVLKTMYGNALVHTSESNLMNTLTRKLEDCLRVR